MDHVFNLKRLIKGRGYGASVWIDAVETKSGLKIGYGEYFNDKWTEAVELGIHYFFYGYFQKNGHLGLEVKVIDVSGHEPDISDDCVVYVSIKCLCEIFDVHVPLIELTEDGEFVFVN